MTKDEFFIKWLDNFAAEIPQESIDRYVQEYGEYIWHVFSWELLDEEQYSVGDAARKAYDDIDKNGAFCIEWFKDDNTKDVTKALNSSKALDELVEVYVVGKNFEWTYIKTHEGDSCGPYFFKKK